MAELWQLSVTELAELVGNRQASVREVVETHLRRIDAVNSDTSEAGWSLTDAATATKVVTGVLAAAAGVLALASAARDGNVDSSDEGPDHAHGQQTPGPLPIQ